MRRLVEKSYQDDAENWNIDLECCHSLKTDHEVPQNIEVHCSQCAGLIFPEAMESYKKTPEFTDESVPNGLRKDHYVRKGAWAKLHVLEGRVNYVMDKPMSKSILLEAGEVGVIPPGLQHFVETPEPSRFFVEFFHKVDCGATAAEIPSTALDPED